MFEHRSHPLLPWRDFLLRLLRMFGITVAMVIISMAIGVCGYHYLTGLPWDNATLRACLILSGHDVHPDVHESGLGGLLFVGFFVLYARLIFVSMAAILLAPVVHRIHHKLHLDPEHLDSSESK